MKAAAPGTEAKSGCRRPALLFGTMYEDWTIESSLFSPGSRVFCIGSAGCTALALASRGHRVDVADANPAQIEYLQSRLSGSPARNGAADILRRRARATILRLGPPADEIRAFLMLDDPAEQARVWKARLEDGPGNCLLDLLLSRPLLRLAHNRGYFDALPAGFAEILRGRFQRTIALHPNRSNPYLWRLLLGETSEPASAPITHPLRLFTADAAEYLEAAPPEFYDAFSLSNILDGVDETYARRLWQSVARAAKPGAGLILRSFQEPRCKEEKIRAAQDRAPFWGRLVYRRVFAENSPDAGFGG